jgi:hypothetical protein
MRWATGFFFLVRQRNLHTRKDTLPRLWKAQPQRFRRFARRASSSRRGAVEQQRLGEGARASISPQSDTGQGGEQARIGYLLSAKFRSASETDSPNPFLRTKPPCL